MTKQVKVFTSDQHSYTAAMANAFLEHVPPANVVSITPLETLGPSTADGFIPMRFTIVITYQTWREEP